MSWSESACCKALQFAPRSPTAEVLVSQATSTLFAEPRFKEDILATGVRSDETVTICVEKHDVFLEIVFNVKKQDHILITSKVTGRTCWTVTGFAFRSSPRKINHDARFWGRIFSGPWLEVFFMRCLRIWYYRPLDWRQIHTILYISIGIYTDIIQYIIGLAKIDSDIPDVILASCWNFRLLKLHFPHSHLRKFTHKVWVLQK